MKKINVKATIFLSAIVLVVVVLLLNLIEFRKTVDFTVPGIQMPKENAFGKQEEVQVSVNGTYYYRVLPWIHGSTFHGQISFVGEGEEPQNYFFTYGASRGFLKEGRGAGWIGTPDAQTTVAIYQAVQNVEKGMISVENPASYVLYPAATPEEAYAIADIWYPGMLENEAKTAFCAAFLPEECPQKIGCSFCAEDYDYVEDVDTVEQLWQEFIQLSGKVTSDPIPPEEMVEGVGYFQFVYADGETRTFRYASEEQGLWIGEDERCLDAGHRFLSLIKQGYAKQYGEELRQYWEATNEVFVWISEQYRKPLYVTSDVTIGDGKTVISFRGTGTSMTTGETEEIHRDCVLDFEMHAEVLRSEEEPELTVSDWNPEEEGQQNQAETIYDPEAGVTVTLRDISNIGASIVIRREDEDAGTEVTYGDAYILQRRIEGEWQDAETIIDDYGFTMIGHTVGCGEEVSNFYKWDWLYGVLEPGEYRMVYDVFRKTEGAGSAQKYREYIRFQL